MRHATQAELMPKETLWSWRGKGGSWNINLREELMAWRGASANTHRFPSSPAAPDWNQQQCPCLFCMNPFLFFSQSRFLKTQTAKKEKEKSTCVQKEKKTPTIHSSPRAVWNKWEFSSVPLSKKQWAKKKKRFFLSTKICSVIPVQTANTDTERCENEMRTESHLEIHNFSI